MVTGLWQTLRSPLALPPATATSRRAPRSPPAQTWTQTLPQNLFAASLLPYLGFLYHLHKATRATKAPGLMLFGFYFLLAFVGASIPAGIYGG